MFFKCENFQKVGAFKARGATNALLKLKKEFPELKLVATHSSGNHAQALAWAAGLFGLKAIIVMPSNAPQVKKQAVLDYGAEVVECYPTLEDRELTLNKIVKNRGAHFIHPYDNYDIIEGQATCVKELIEDIPDLDFILAPVGGGGLLAGTALGAMFFSENARVIGCEPQMADDAYRSFHHGSIFPSIDPDTIADGLKTSLGLKTFPIIKENVNGIITVPEEGIIEAMRVILERMKIVVEPSGAVPLAAMIEDRFSFEGKKVGIIISGGNISLHEAVKWF